MADMYEILRDNLTRLRKSRGLTQADLANILKYSDKSVSKWETGETLPSIETLVHLSDFYGIPVDDLLRKSVDTEQTAEVEKIRRTNKAFISILSIAAVWLIAITIFVGSALTNIGRPSQVWIAFVWACPVTFIVCIIISLKWHKKHLHIWFSLLLWTFIASIFLTITVFGDNTNYWMLFLIGIPLQIIIILIRGLRYDIAREQLERQNQQKEKFEMMRQRRNNKNNKEDNDNVLS